ncbi:MAG: NADH-quinone oxidoreductase subunit NuoE [Ignavibacteria bacterium]|jgi:NADH-quinone oxidoreductase subunit E|nr:NADH-quinone oxidoreductase subunit NuoE [Ignavibacteria bacterium]HEX2963902.1 NADH-quinone oxidoreductase subunit NuoE [Ignavibacteriales bacterium]MCU7498228.1 NADH-quinone oxidoreductase subunit NuoE [Ignavibacteria bacterium]MCU7511280.1 NADH-quinone oxidoreductase subunit NuoE [Ignavibacteria bacterium]MCU7518998.1 NADH-quinone oxidoreductase subunit NuoE [Ignavibacteria bacterium]
MIAEKQILSRTRKFGKVCEILDRYSNDSAKLIPILQAVQEEYRYLPEEVLTFVATSLNLSPARVYGVATFYSHFALEPKGKYVIRVCDGTACHVKGSMSLAEVVMEKLNLDEKRRTTPDMLFTLETVSCLGACGLAPVMVINDEVHGQMTPEKTGTLIDQIIEMEKSYARNN